MENDPHALGFTKLMDNPKITETTFKSCIEVFLNNRDKPKDQQDQTAYETYLSIVRTEYTRVDVVDDESGEVLFWAPQLKYKPDTTKVDIHKTVMEMEKLKSRNPKRVKELAAEALDGMKEITIPEEDVAQWKMIYARYGFIEGKPLVTEEETVETKEILAATDEDEEW